MPRSKAKVVAETISTSKVSPPRIEGFSQSESLVEVALNDASLPILERAKLAVELQKMEIERDKLAVAASVEDFKARWQELLNFENENSRWQTLYVTALMLVTGWVLTNLGPDGRYKTLDDLFAGDNSYFLLSLALINAIYTLAMAYKGFQIQEIAQYLFIGATVEIAERTDTTFNDWERWRRDEKGRPTFIRKIYYSIIGMLPTAVSSVILILYCGYAYSDAGWKLTIYFYGTIVFVFATFIAAVGTTQMNAAWDKILGTRKLDL